MQVAACCIERARENRAGPVTEQELTQAYQEFLDLVRKVCPKDFDKIFNKDGSLKLEASLFEGSSPTWDVIENQILKSKNVPTAKGEELKYNQKIVSECFKAIHSVTPQGF